MKGERENKSSSYLLSSRIFRTLSVSELQSNLSLNVDDDDEGKKSFETFRRSTITDENNQ